MNAQQRIDQAESDLLARVMLDMPALADKYAKIKQAEADADTPIRGYAWLPDGIEYATQWWDGEAWKDTSYSPYATAEAAFAHVPHLAQTGDTIRVIERVTRVRVITA